MLGLQVECIHVYSAIFDKGGEISASLVLLTASTDNFQTDLIQILSSFSKSEDS